MVVVAVRTVIYYATPKKLFHVIFELTGQYTYRCLCVSIISFSCRDNL